MGSILAFLIPPTYRAEARLLTLYAGYYDMQLDRSAAAVGNSLNASQVVNVEAQILASPELHRAVVAEDAGASANAATLDRRLREFEDHFHIEKLETANVIELTFADSDPHRAAHILDQVIAQYFRQRADVFTLGRVSFLVAQRDKVKTQLDKANAELIAFQKQHDVVNIEAQISSAVALRGLLLQRKLENDNALVQDISTLATLGQEAHTVPANIVQFTDNTETAHTLNTMQLTLLQLEARRADLASRYMEDSPFVRQIDQQIADVKRAIAGQKPEMVTAVRTGHNTYYDTVQDRIVRLSSDVAGERARKDSLEKQNQQALDRIQYLISVANQLRRMEIDRDLLVDSFKNFSRQVEQARIDQNQVDTTNSTNVRIIQAPFPPSHRSNPPILFVAASVVAGLLMSGLSILLLSSLRETFLSPEEIERALHLPVLSAPIMPGKPARRPAAPSFWRPRWRRSRGSPPLAPPTAPPETPPPLRPRRPRTEYGRAISTINHSSDAPAKVTLLLAASQDEEGLRAVTQGLARELERRSTRPILVLDLMAPHGAILGTPDTNGLLHWLGQPDESSPSWVGAKAPPGSSPETQSLFSFNAVERHHIVVGRLRPNTLPPVGRQGVEVFSALRQAHDYILVPVPAADASFVGIDTAILADATILVVRAEATRRPVVQTLKSQILDAGGSVLGVAMTNRYSYIPAFVYRFL